MVFLLTVALRARCLVTRMARQQVTRSRKCRRNSPHSHATATPSSRIRGSCGTKRRRRRRSACWSAWRERRKGRRRATEDEQEVQETFDPQILSPLKVTRIPSCHITCPGTTVCTIFLTNSFWSSVSTDFIYISCFTVINKGVVQWCEHVRVGLSERSDEIIISLKSRNV